MNCRSNLSASKFDLYAAQSPKRQKEEEGIERKAALAEANH